MTLETKTFIEFGDIIRVQLECLKCRTKTILPIGMIHNYPVRCENCKQEWFIGQETGKTKFYTTLNDLATVQAWVRELPKNGAQIKLSLELAVQEKD